MEILGIIGSPKECRFISLGKILRICIENKNPTYKNYNNDRVIIRKLVLEEYGPDIEYIRGEKNILW